MNISMIWPHGFQSQYVLPLALAYLKATLDGQRHNISIIDCTLHNQTEQSPWFEDQIRNQQPDLVVISSWSITFPQAIRALNRVKEIKPDAITCMGGAHASSKPLQTIQYSCVDFVLCGEAENSFQNFVSLLSESNPSWDKVAGLAYKVDGKVFKNPVEIPQDLDSIPFPDYRFIQLQEYLNKGYQLNADHPRNAPLWLTRGCPYRCSFCAAPELNGRLIRQHSIEYIKKWVLDLYHNESIRHFSIIDDNFTFDTQFAENFCRAMIDLNLDISFGTPNGIRVQRGSPELWRLMKKAGWSSLIIAPESGSLKTLKRMKKDLDIDKIPEKINAIHRAGLQVQGLFIIGYPGETPGDLKLTLDFIKKCSFDFIFLNVFQPLPGTPIYDQLVKEGEIDSMLLPNNYSEGTRSYVTQELQGFNFPLFVLKTYFIFSLNNPVRVARFLSRYNWQFLFHKISRNILSLFKSTARKSSIENIAPVASPNGLHY